MQLLDQLRTSFTEQLPNVVQAVLILIIGWLVAMVLAALTRGLLGRLRVDERLNSQMDHDQQFRLTDWVSRFFFWVVMLLAIVGVLNALNLTSMVGVLQGLLDQLIGFIPNLISAGLLTFAAWFFATVAKRLIEGTLNATDWDERLNRSAQIKQGVSLGQSLGQLIYWLIWLFFLPGILEALAIEGLLTPVQELVNQVVGFLPDLFSSAVILIVGYFVARIVRDLVTNLLMTTGLDDMAQTYGFSHIEASDTSHTTVSRPPLSLSGLIGTLVFALILIPVVISALDVLNLSALSEPAIAMLNQVLEAIPAIFAAAILLVIAYFVARLMADLVTNILAGMGFDRILTRIGLRDATTGNQQPSQIVGTIMIVGIMLFASAEAANLLQFTALSSLITQFLLFFGDVLLGLVVLGIGFYLANLADQTIRESGMQNTELLAPFARYSLILLTITMALRQMGIAEDIVTLAFGLLLGAIAIAFALAFGLGGREIAANELKKIVQAFRQPS